MYLRLELEPTGWDSEGCVLEYLWNKLISAKSSQSFLSPSIDCTFLGKWAPLSSDSSLALLCLPKKTLPSHHLRYCFFREAFLEFPLLASQWDVPDICFVVLCHLLQHKTSQNTVQTGFVSNWLTKNHHFILLPKSQVRTLGRAGLGAFIWSLSTRAPSHCWLEARNSGRALIGEPTASLAPWLGFPHPCTWNLGRVSENNCSERHMQKPQSFFSPGLEVPHIVYISFLLVLTLNLYLSLLVKESEAWTGGIGAWSPDPRGRDLDSTSQCWEQQRTWGHISSHTRDHITAVFLPRICSGWWAVFAGLPPNSVPGTCSHMFVDWRNESIQFSKIRGKVDWETHRSTLHVMCIYCVCNKAWNKSFTGQPQSVRSAICRSSWFQELVSLI